ncbi:GD25244 [Drosophila simulans]|uniref:GD25244 n=1 Tax=Drosophila simulans TaxID=7240 RepID=B4QFI7_DROSI|nr:GD25244 [Drosophila simulans]
MPVPIPSHSDPIPIPIANLNTNPNRRANMSATVSAALTKLQTQTHTHTIASPCPAAIVRTGCGTGSGPRDLGSLQRLMLMPMLMLFERLISELLYKHTLFAQQTATQSKLCGRLTSRTPNQKYGGNQVQLVPTWKYKES